jgi:coatomer subunit beta'
MLEEALEIATDTNYRFDLAVQLGRLEIAKAYLLSLLSKLFRKYHFPFFL